jgi:UPF0755 protein
MSARRRLVIAGAVMLALAVLAAARVGLYLSHLDAPMAIDGTRTLMVAPGTNLTRVLRGLEDDGVLASSLDLRIHARLQGGERIQAGEYLLQAGETARDLLRKLVAGEVVYHEVRIVEGWTLREALLAMQSQPALVATLDANDPVALQAAFGSDTYPEGEFFPDTYRFARGETDKALLDRARALMTEVLQSAWATRDANLPFTTPGEALTLASIIEKETAVAHERSQIAGVFVRRLQRGMRLQTDPAVIYGLGSAFDGNLTRAHLDSDTPWNTYTRAGLPPTPIALPGRAALDAALHPDDSGSLYFVATGDGTHYFSATLEEHNRAVAQYQLGRGQNRNE